MSGNGAASRLNRAWRLAGTGLAFAAIFAGGAVLALTVIPVATLLTRDPKRRRRRAQRIVQIAFRFCLAMLRLFGVIRFDVVGAERLATCRGRLVVSNHPGLLDVVILMSLVPNAQCVVKHELWAHPLMRFIVRAAGYIRNDLAPEEMMARCAASLAEGDNLIIFPEGTRSTPGAALRFQRGFAHVATIARADLQPVRISCEPPTLLKGDAWYLIPERAPRFRVEAGSTIAVAPLLRDVARPLAARRLVARLEEWYAGDVLHG